MSAENVARPIPIALHPSELATGRPIARTIQRRPLENEERNRSESMAPAK